MVFIVESNHSDGLSNQIRIIQNDFEDLRHCLGFIVVNYLVTTLSDFLTIVDVENPKRKSKATL